MARKVRIIRNTVNFRQSIFRFARLIEAGLRIYNRHTRDNRLDVLTAARLRKLEQDTFIAETRNAVLHNQLVLQDLKIEKMKGELGYTNSQNAKQMEGKVDWRD